MKIRGSPRLWEYGGDLKELLPTVNSPVFSEIVVVFSKREVRWPPLSGLADPLREMHEAREFRLVFFLETAEENRAQNLQLLTSEIQAEVAKGSFSFLSSPPLAFPRTVEKYDPLWNP